MVSCASLFAIVGSVLSSSDIDRFAIGHDFSSEKKIGGTTSRATHSGRALDIDRFCYALPPVFHGCRCSDRGMGVSFADLEIISRGLYS